MKGFFQVRAPAAVADAGVGADSSESNGWGDALSKKCCGSKQGDRNEGGYTSKQALSSLLGNWWFLGEGVEAGVLGDRGTPAVVALM